MTAIEIDGIPYVPRGRFRRTLRVKLARASERVRTAARSAAPLLVARSRPVVRHFQDHAYTLLGFACFDAAWFTHSVFSGLLWTAATLIAFEYKVSSE